MTATALRPLPGFAFETVAPVYTDVLPRMDVAVFAGFAARGPVNVAVPVEDAGQFAAVFGDDAALAWDADLGRTISAQLAPAVRVFFTNGGVRCWIIRLTGDAQSNTFAVPGLAAVTSVGHIDPLVLTASSPGSWSDDVELSASLVMQRFAVRRWDLAAHEIDVVGPSDAPIAPGDLLRVTCRDEGTVLYASVESVTSHDSGGTTRRIALRVITSDEQWLDVARVPGRLAGTARIGALSVPVTYVSAASGENPLASNVQLTIATDARSAPRPGEVIVATFGADTLLLSVRQSIEPMSVDSPVAQNISVSGDGVWVRDRAPVSIPSLTAVSVERLSLDLWARVAGDNPQRIGGLGLTPGNARHVELLPTDDSLFDTEGGADPATWSDAQSPRFPAAGSGSPRLCLPFGVGTLPGAFLPAIIPAGVPLERDGLAPFDATLFGDETLANRLATTLIADAEYMRYLAPITREPTGLQRALAIEEATLIAVPDAAQPGWVPMDKGTPPPPDPSESDSTDPRDDPPFLDCGAVEGRGPFLEATAHDASGSVALDWVAAAGTTSFVVEEATTRDWTGAIAAFQGTGNSTTIGPRLPGDYYYRVRGVGDHPTEWSNGVGVRLAGANGWRMRRPSEYRDDVLVAAHRMLVRICAARRDVMAMLSLPAYYRDGAAMAHVQLLGAADAPSIPVGTSVVPPLSVGEGDALSFAALYHGWLATIDDDGTVRDVAPDGPACGVIARRAIARGAWIAPANELLRGVVALERPASPSRWQDLQQLQINTMRQSARGFMAMSADTLSDDDDLRPISVRRLLILLRRAALRLGTTYVFEPSNDSFRRMVQRGFDAMLGDLFQRGAFAGNSAATAFQVRTDASLNTPASMDEGRFIVELRVAPSRPMTFLTIRLVQVGERLTATGA